MAICTGVTRSRGVFAFQDREETGTKMLARIAKHTGLKPGEPASEFMTKGIADFADWRGETLGRMRTLSILDGNARRAGPGRT